MQWLRFEGLHFENTDWIQPGEEGDPLDTAWSDPSRTIHNNGRNGRGSAGQADADVSGVIFLKGARNCAIENCRIANTGWYAIDLGDGCMGNRIVGNEMFDLGGGGVKLNGAAHEDHACKLWTGNNQVTDNHIHSCGRVFFAATGIHAMHTFGNELSHNHIHDLFYTGISCGWCWGVRDSICRENKIQYNHIHDLGHGMLSDMGGIYTLGVQPGTVLRGNLIHDVEKLNYGAWCIYPDEGSSHVLIENNVCYSTNGEIFHQHYGRENIVRNNIFAFGADAMAAHGRVDYDHKAFTFTRNIFISDGAPMFKAGYGCQLEDRNHESDLNLFWDVSGAEPVFARNDGTKIDLAAWRALGHDRHAVVADPKCADAKNGDFTLAPDSPAITELGFEPIDLSSVGPRPPDKRQATPGMKRP